MDVTRDFDVDLDAIRSLYRANYNAAGASTAQACNVAALMSRGLGTGKDRDPRIDVLRWIMDDELIMSSYDLPSPVAGYLITLFSSEGDNWSLNQYGSWFLGQATARAKS